MALLNDQSIGKMDGRAGPGRGLLRKCMNISFIIVLLYSYVYALENEGDAFISNSGPERVVAKRYNSVN